MNVNHSHEINCYRFQRRFICVRIMIYGFIEKLQKCDLGSVCFLQGIVIHQRRQLDGDSIAWSLSRDVDSSAEAVSKVVHFLKK